MKKGGAVPTDSEGLATDNVGGKSCMSATSKLDDSIELNLDTFGVREISFQHVSGSV